ncbi:MAG: hypothetical protein JXR64_00050 [Spirochaetales bacterium]|nr:hypothetical protein [Spirochaetales bacterium]
MKKIFILITYITTFTIFSQNSFISGVFINPVSRYFDMDMEANNNEFPVEEEFINDIIEVVSGMIYGWEFTYIPSDIKREIDEIFEIKPIALIKKGDPNMRFRDNWVKDYIMYQNIVYNLEDFQKKRIESWSTAVIPSSYGEAEYSLFDVDGKSLSLKEALKDSIKREFQTRGKDKPRRISGQMLLKEMPRLFINSGQYNTQVEVFILYKNIEDYKYH